MAKQDLYASYTHYANHASQRFGKTAKEASFFRTMHKLTAAETCKVGPRGDQVPSVKFGSLEQCRAAFAKAVCDPEWEWTD